MNCIKGDIMFTVTFTGDEWSQPVESPRPEGLAVVHPFPDVDLDQAINWILNPSDGDSKETHMPWPIKSVAIYHPEISIPPFGSARYYFLIDPDFETEDRSVPAYYKVHAHD
jgi:hypothetical protein